MPLVTDLLETCVDEVIRVPVTMATAGLSEEVGPGAALSASSTVTEDSMSLTDAAARLKQLEIESTLVSAPPRVNVNMNNQEDVVKLTEKCLNSMSGSPSLPPLKVSEEMKSNILKAQAEAALKGTREELGATADKNCNLQETATRLKGRGGRMGSTSSLTVGSGRPERQESWDLVKPGLLPCSTSSLEVKPEDHITSAPSLSAEPVTEVVLTQGNTEEQEPVGAPVSDNLIDFTDPTPVAQPKPMITPRWIIPTTTPGTFSNGLLDLNATVKIAPLHPEGGVLATQPHLPHTHNVMTTSIVANPPKEDNPQPKGLLTTEL